ncbi:MAG TPA: molybdopterin-dependent oxidoreductase [Chloroflexota bacterium]|jgi:DMSO/TMAO reductase YedYZ molybdopterin-dependent catalytic subunit|nr:molybdopterin-dependent oxidoreductase [Chloroflexota bacterium]
MPRRLTNDLLLALVLALVLSGVLGWALPVATASPLYDLHRLLGVAVLLTLLIWKQAVIRASLRRRLGRRPWDRSVVWGALGAIGLVLGVAIGIAWTLGLISWDLLWGYSPLNIHVFVGIGLLPFVAVHTLRRRRTNRASSPVWSRRAAVRASGLAVASVVGWQLTRLGDRRFTGSKAVPAVLTGNAYPAEIWLFDQVPVLDADSWRMQLSGLLAPATLGLSDLQAYPTRTVQAVLDCTSGWWTEQVWTGVPLLEVLQKAGMSASAAQVTVTSTTGHRIVFAADDLHELLLTTHVGNEPLSAGHGYPVRLVAPGRRGYQWVKWVSRIEVT